MPDPHHELPGRLTPVAVAQMRWAMGLSLAIGVVMLGGKVAAYVLTGSAAILSDAAESVIHVAAVAFAAFSLWLSLKPPDARFRYGYERIAYFSAGFEGALIALAAVYILNIAVRHWIAGAPLQNLGPGALVVLAAGLLNGGLGWYLVRTGRRNQSIILEANGRHVLTDCWTSIGVVLGLVLVLITGLRWLDPLCAIVIGLNILVSGARLVWRSVSGLMDYADPQMAETLRQRIDALCQELGLQYHGLRFRNTGFQTHVVFHLLFPAAMSVGEAHRLATTLEERLVAEVDSPLDVTTHLESLEDHAEVHREHHYTGV